ncbi:MAG: alpha/beta fold hydrolase [Pseudomonadota bacterium]|nr:alpha/beta fold hydrolase [Pseudomonadota bacterium]MEE3070886.1 alpha/beta fold hydrolase [Pseudomonadota bacterium]
MIEGQEMQNQKGRACRWHVDGLVYEGLEWGETGDLRILALHGWMDHADSFAELAPRLTGCHVVALDLSGQGLSSHRAAHATYNIWDDLPQIAGILDQMRWTNCVLMGHSRGANIASLFTAAQPHRVKALIALDSLVSEPSEKSIVETLRAFVEDTRAATNRPLRHFPSRADYVARRSARGNSHATSTALAPRALHQTPRGYRLRGDARMFASSAVKLSQQQAETVLASITCPVLNIWATDGLKQRGTGSAELAIRAAELMSRYEALDIAGDHHFHLDPGVAGKIAATIHDFLRRHQLT